MILTAPLLLCLSLLVTALGQVVAFHEKWGKFDGVYWAFITASTVGYGDIRPIRRLSKVLSIFIAFTGIMFTGIIVAITVESARVTFDQHVDSAQLESIAEEIK